MKTQDSTLRQLLREHGLCGRFSGHHPRFRVEEFQKDLWWIWDGSIQVGMVNGQTQMLELINTDPLAPRPFQEFPAIYHAPNQPGDRIALAKWGKGQRTHSDAYHLALEAEETRVRVRFEESWNGGRRASKEAEFLLDPDFGYVVEFRDENVDSAPHVVEFTNLMVRGVTDDRPEKVRYRAFAFQHPDGDLYSQELNHAGCCTLGNKDIWNRRRIANGGFLGHFGEPDHNPAVEFLECVPEASAETCHALFDEHILWGPHGAESVQPDAQGCFRWHAHCRLVGVPGTVGDAVLARSKPLDLITDRIDPEVLRQRLERHSPRLLELWPRKKKDDPYAMNFRGMYTGQICDFEKSIPPEQHFRGIAFPYLEDTADPICIASDQARSGKFSLRVRVDGELLAATSPSVLHVTPWGCHRLSGWVKTDLQNGSARLVVQDFIFNFADTNAFYRSTEIGGRKDWTRLEVEFTPGERGHVIAIFFEVEGTGTAWLDDLLLESIDG